MARRRGVKFVCSLHRVAFRAKANHDHVSFVELERTAMDIGRPFNFGVIIDKALLHLLVCLGEVGGEMNGFSRMGCLGWEEDEVHRQIWCMSCVYLKWRKSRSAMSRCIICKFCPREEIIPGVGVFLDQAT